MINNQISS